MGLFTKKKKKKIIKVIILMIKKKNQLDQYHTLCHQILIIKWIKCIKSNVNNQIKETVSKIDALNILSPEENIQKWDITIDGKKYDVSIVEKNISDRYIGFIICIYKFIKSSIRFWFSAWL